MRRREQQPGDHPHLLKREIHELVCDGVVRFRLKDKKKNMSKKKSNIKSSVTLDFSDSSSYRHLSTEALGGELGRVEGLHLRIVEQVPARSERVVVKSN